MDVSSDDWNQPRCWSEPSRYRSAGKRRPSLARWRHTLVWDTPDSHHTSRMSFSGRSSVQPQTSHFVPRGRYSEGSMVNHASAPLVLNSSITASKVSSVATVEPHLAHLNTGMGTPQLRWREMHQSGRSATMDPMRFFAQAGTQLTSELMAVSARSRRAFLSMETNH